ncbi:MAG: DNA internalization-related competence protein ComEC/Rec2 [Desulfobacterales bacterium]|nr:DNA internalization-related competence protein ComEC/Rec2 [Desulfobacterales bacterium]
MSYARPVIPLLIAFIFGIASGNISPGYQIYSFAVILISSGYLFFLFKNNQNGISSPIILFFSLGYLAIQPWVSEVFPSNHVVNFAGEKEQTIIGIIESYNRSRFVVKVEKINSISVTGKMQITVNEMKFFEGDRVLFSGKIKKIKNFRNPGGFDYVKYMAFKNIRVSAYVSNKKIKLIEKNNRSFSYRNFMDGIGNGDAENIFKSLIIGDTSCVSTDLWNKFNKTGISHILSISGFHISIVAGTFFLFLKFIFERIDYFLWNALVKKACALIAIIPVWIYIFLSGMSDPSIRSGIMITIFLIGLLLEKDHEPINTLAFAAIIILITYPPSLFSISFQLSFAAVFSILLLPYKQKGILISSLLITLSVTIGTLPIIMLYFNQISFISFISNLIIAPIIGFTVIPMGLISLFLYPVSLTLSGLFIKMSIVILNIGIYFVDAFANIPFAYITTITPSYIEIFLYYAFILAVFKCKTRRFIVIGVILLIFTCDVSYWCYNRFYNKNLKITFIDVGQGNAALLEFPEGYTMLIDGGGFYDNSIFDVGANIVAKFLWQKKIQTIDTIILTHANSDHLNGLFYIAENFNVKNFWSNGEGEKQYDLFVDIIKKKGIYHPNYKELPREHIINGVKIEILYPSKDFIEKKQVEKWRDINNNSLVTKISFGSTSFLFPGDITEKAEEEIVNLQDNNLKSTVLIAPHHGSKTSSTEFFLNYVQPQIVIISLGYQNYFKFPHASVIGLYNKRDYKILRTDLYGAIEFTVNEKGVTYVF